MSAMDVSDESFMCAVQKVIQMLPGISELYPSQLELLRSLVDQQNTFLTSPTNSGKTLPAVILPKVLEELNAMGFLSFSTNSKVLFLTALNSIQLSLLAGTRSLGIKCDSVTSKNVVQVLNSDASVVFIGPEMIQMPHVTRALITARKTFCLKVIDEVHLCNYCSKLCS